MRLALLTTDNREHHRKYDLRAPYFGTAPEALLQGFALLPDIEVHVVSCTQKPMESPEKIAENIWFHSVHVKKIGWLRTGYQGCVRAVRRKLKEIQPDIVHGQGTERDCAISAVFSGFPNVITIHGNMAELAHHFRARIVSFGWLAGKLEDLTLPRAAGVLCNSSYTESLVSVRASKTWRVANPIRIPFFQPSASIRNNPRPIILNIGNITPRKQQVETLEMFQSLHQEGYEFEILFLGSSGDDEYSRTFRKKLDELSTQRYARYLGALGLEELVATMDQADAVCHFPTEEAFGLVVAEALARNLKFFGFAVGGIVDIESGIESTQLYTLGDWTSVRLGISKWIRKNFPPPVSASSIMAARYHPKVIAERHLEIYREVLTRG